MLFVLPIPCRAAETDELREFIGEESLFEYAPDGWEENIASLTEGKSYGSFWNRVRDFLTQAFSLGIADGAKLLAQVSGIMLIGAIFRAASPTENRGIQSVFRTVYLLILTLAVWDSLESALSLVIGTMDGVCAFLTASLPVSSLLLAMNGEVERATLQGVSLQHVIGIFSVITTGYLGPILRYLLALTLAGAAAGDQLGQATVFIAKFMKRSCLFLFTLLSAILALQNALAAAADSVAMRTVRFAAGSFIPVVGNLVGEASRTLAAGIDLIRKECGVTCIIILAYLLARPLILLLTQKIVLSASNAVASVLGDKDSAGLLKGLIAVWDLFLAVIAFQGCYCLFSIILFLNGGNT